MPNFGFIASLCLVCLVIVIPEGIAFGAEGNSGSKWSVRAWQADDGLPDNNVTGIAQTSDGYLWVSTHAGLARFDGVRFVDQPLPVHGGISNSLVRTMLLGRGNELWLAGEAAGGLVVGFSGSSTNILTSAEGVPSFKPISMTQTPDGAVWVGYVDGSARRYYRGEAGRFGTREGLGGTGGCWLVTDQSGMLWFAKAGHVGVFERDHFVERFEFPEQIIRVAPARDGGVWILSGLQLFKAATNAEPVLVGTLPELRAGVEPSVLFESRQGQVWLGTKSGGLVLWNGRTFLPVATSHSDITSVFEDNEGNIWVGTEGGGLDRLRNQILELNGSSLGLPFETARSVCVDDQGTVWAAGANGTLVRQVNGQWKTMADALGWSNPRVTSVAGDEHGGVWVGTYHGGLLHWRGDRFESFSREDGLAGDVVRAMLVDSRGDLWIGLEAANCLQQLSGGKFKTFSQPTGSRTIRAIVEDVSGRIWLGTSDGYLLRVDGDHIVDETSRALQPTKPIRALHASKDGALWIGYAAAGLGLLRDGKFSKFGTEHGMPDNYICGIQSDDGGGLWFTASHGLFQIRQREFDQIAEGRSSRLLAVDFGRNEGLPNLQGSYGYWPAYAKDRIGNIWFATRSGLVSTSPSRVQANRIPPKVIIERLVVDGRVLPVRPGEVPVLTPNHRRIEVEFTALNFAAPDSILLQYRLAGWDENWSDPKPERSAVFSRMPAGLYEFQVAARNAAGIWNHEGARISFKVEPFLYQRWWFRVATLIVFVVVLIVAVRLFSYRRLRRQLQSLEQEAALARERARIAQDLHDDLGANLTQIALLSELAQNDFTKPVEARGHIDHIFRTAKALTRSLDEIVWAVNPKNDSLENFVAHFCTYAPEFLRSAGVRCRLDVPVEVPHIMLPSDVRHHLHLAVKEALHNVAKHAGAKEVKLQLKLAAEELMLVIEDDGTGMAVKPAPEQDGLLNFENRMREVGGKFERRSGAGRGTILSFVVPLREGRAIRGGA